MGSKFFVCSGKLRCYWHFALVPLFHCWSRLIKILSFSRFISKLPPFSPRIKSFHKYTFSHSLFLTHTDTHSNMDTQTNSVFIILSILLILSLQPFLSLSLCLHRSFFVSNLLLPQPLSALWMIISKILLNYELNEVIGSKTFQTYVVLCLLEPFVLKDAIFSNSMLLYEYIVRLWKMLTWKFGLQFMLRWCKTLSWCLNGWTYSDIIGWLNCFRINIFSRKFG